MTDFLKHSKTQKMPSYLKFKNVEGHPDFQMKLNMDAPAERNIEFPCGCGFLIPPPFDDSALDMCYWMYRLYGGRQIKEEESHWSNPNFESRSRSAHVFCEKDEEQIRRINETVENRREKIIAADPFYDESASERKINDWYRKKLYLLFLISDEPNDLRSFLCFVFVRIFFFICVLCYLCVLIVKMLLPTTTESSNGKKFVSRLPNSVKIDLQQAHKYAMAASSNDQLAKNDFQARKINKKTHQKKPNRGKTPNNIRKTKKPARL